MYVQSASFGYKFGYEGDVRVPFGDVKVPPQAPSFPELNKKFDQLASKITRGQWPNCGEKEIEVGRDGE